jgi:hypothetical protein
MQPRVPSIASLTVALVACAPLPDEGEDGKADGLYEPPPKLSRLNGLRASLEDTCNQPPPSEPLAVNVYAWEDGEIGARFGFHDELYCWAAEGGGLECGYDLEFDDTGLRYETSASVRWTPDVHLSGRLVREWTGCDRSPEACAHRFPRGLPCRQVDALIASAPFGTEARGPIAPEAGAYAIEVGARPASGAVCAIADLPGELSIEVPEAGRLRLAHYPSVENSAWCDARPDGQITCPLGWWPERPGTVGWIRGLWTSSRSFEAALEVEEQCAAGAPGCTPCRSVQTFTASRIGSSR